MGDVLVHGSSFGAQSLPSAAASVTSVPQTTFCVEGIMLCRVEPFPSLRGLPNSISLEMSLSTLFAVACRIEVAVSWEKHAILSALGAGTQRARPTGRLSRPPYVHTQRRTDRQTANMRLTYLHRTCVCVYTSDSSLSWKACYPHQAWNFCKNTPSKVIAFHSHYEYMQPILIHF